MSQLLISAANKSSGKTTLSTAICAALTGSGNMVQAFKKGPDYIDPMWLGAATGRDCYNLDFWTQTDAEMTEMVCAQSAGCDLTVIEANKGLYDGLALDGSNSNAALAKLLGTPVVLVLDTRGTIRGVAPLVLGYQHFDRDVNIAGMILNFVGGARHEKKLRQVIEQYTDVPILGAVRRNSELELEERHLGLMPSNEDQLAQEKIQRLAQAAKDQIDLEKLLSIAAPLPKATRTTPAEFPNYPLRVGYARDEAFGFYYADDLQTFKQFGVELIPFDTLHDSTLPNVDALFIGGGFPEMRMEQLSNNIEMREQIRNALINGLPAYAECGGLMYLSRALHYRGKSADMVGLIDADCVMNDRPQGRGYIEIEEHNPLWPQAKQNALRGHEFHYSHLENWQPTKPMVYSVTRGVGVDGNHDGIHIHNTLACYAHQRHTAQNPWIARFLEFALKHKR